MGDLNPLNRIEKNKFFFLGPLGLRGPSNRRKQMKNQVIYKLLDNKEFRIHMVKFPYFLGINPVEKNP